MNTDESELALFRAERRVREIQAKLHRWARDDPHRRFDDLFVRHEAPGIEWRCEDFTAGQSQLTGEAGGSQDVGTHAMVGAALTTYGTGRHCQTAWVRQAVMRRRTRGTAV